MGDKAADECGDHGCAAVPFPPSAFCFAHLRPEVRAQTLRDLAPGSDVDLSRTTLTAGLLAQLLDALRHDGSPPGFGRISFEQATFVDATDFNDVTFRGNASFDGAKFEQSVGFANCDFYGGVTFRGAEFHDLLTLGRPMFGRGASFELASFADPVVLGPVYGLGSLGFDRATFAGSVTVDADVPEISFVGTRFGGATTLRLQSANVWLDAATLADTVTVVSAEIPPHPTHENLHSPHSEALIGTTSIGSLRGVDAAKLVLSGVDLSRCRFAGAYNLDRIRIEGRCAFAETPRGVRCRRGWPPVWWWTRRQTIIEEHRWRSRSGGRPEGWMAEYPVRPQSSAGWRQPTHPERLSAIYRQLRKAFEDAKNEPGAADFYFGETDMRRKSPSTPRSERFVLTLYWLLSGYGLRASRALLALAALVAVTTWLLVTHGLAAADASTEQALRSALNAVVFRSDDAALTTSGTYVEMVARVLGPILLALAALSVRNRVKR